MQTLNDVLTGEETLWAAVADMQSAAPLQPEPGILAGSWIRSGCGRIRIM